MCVGKETHTVYRKRGGKKPAINVDVLTNREDDWLNQLYGGDSQLAS